MSYQYIECESGLFIATPLIVTLRRVGSVPRRRTAVPPMPMPVSLVAIIEGGQGQQRGDVGSVAVAGDLFAPDVGVGHGGWSGLRAWRSPRPPCKRYILTESPAFLVGGAASLQPAAVRPSRARRPQVKEKSLFIVKLFELMD